MNIAEAVLSGTRPPGLYRTNTQASPQTIMDELAAARWRGFYINGRNVVDKPSFLQTFAQALDFPGYFGHNWDAFEDSITDMEWAPAQGYVVLYDGVAHLAARQPADWKMAQAILKDAVVYWQRKPSPMYVLLLNSWWYTQGLETL